MSFQQCCLKVTNRSLSFCLLMEAWRGVSALIAKKSVRLEWLNILLLLSSYTHLLNQYQIV